MDIRFRILKDQTLLASSGKLGMQGDHNVNTIKVSFDPCGHEFVSGQIHFTMPNGEEKCTDNIPINAEQTLSYTMPYPLFLEAGEVIVSVTALTADGEHLSTNDIYGYVGESSHGKRIIEDKIAELEQSVNELTVRIGELSSVLESVLDGGA